MLRWTNFSCRFYYFSIKRKNWTECQWNRGRVEMGGRYTTGHCVSGQSMCSHPQYVYLRLHQILKNDSLYFGFYSNLSITILLLWFVRNVSEPRLELKLWNCWELNFDLNTFGYRYWDAEQPDWDSKGNPSHLDKKKNIIILLSKIRPCNAVVTHVTKQSHDCPLSALKEFMEHFISM